MWCLKFRKTAVARPPDDTMMRLPRVTIVSVYDYQCVPIKQLFYKLYGFIILVLAISKTSWYVIYKFDAKFHAFIVKCTKHVNICYWICKRGSYTCNYGSHSISLLLTLILGFVSDLSSSKNRYQWYNKQAVTCGDG